MMVGGVTYKTGLVADAKPGFARVRFDDLDELVTDWLPVIHSKTQDDKIIWTLDIGEHVACLMDAHMEDGCIVGAIYSQVDTPPVSSTTKFAVRFKDGGLFEYDRSDGSMTIVAKGSANVSVSGDATVSVAGNAFVTAAKATVDAICDFLKLCTFKAGALFPGGVGGSGGVGTTIPGTVQAESIKTAGGIDLDGHHHTEQGNGKPTSVAQS